MAGYPQAQTHRRLAMITDRKASLSWMMLREGYSVASVARKLSMGEKTVRKYRDADRLPSQMEPTPRAYRTRKDPLADCWEAVEKLLQRDSQLKPFAILQWLKQKYNKPDREPVVTDSIRRTLERRVGRWKLANEVEQEVMFPQVHHPGDVMALDFVVMNSLGVTVEGRRFDHMLFHAVFTYSNWEYVHLCHSESFEALSTGLQDALHRAGGVPRRIRSDSLSAAVNNLSSDKEFASQYRSLLSHYGVQGHRINVRKPHENGDVESSHGHMKTSVDQALRLRGSRDFTSVQELMAFIEEVVARRNASRAVAFREECVALGPLPSQRLSTFTVVRLTVKPDCILRIKRNAYSVSSKYIGLKVDMRIQQDHLELWYRNECLERMPRLFGNGKEAIDFRHVIDSLVRKPGAFVNYKYVNHMYPTTRFRMAYDQLVKSQGDMPGVKQYLKILYAAKHEGLDAVDDVLRWFFSEGKTITASDVEATFKSRQQIPGPTDVNVEPPSLDVFDSLLQHKEVYHEETTDLGEQSDEVRCDLDAYDRHLQTLGPAEGTEVTDVSGGSHHGGGAGGTRALDAHAVLIGLGQPGVPIAKPKPHCPLDEKRPSLGRQDLGAIRLVSASAACDTAVRNASQWRLPRPTGQPADFRETGFGQDEPPMRIGRPAGAAGAIGLLLHLSDVGPGIAASQAGLSLGTGHQEATQVRSVDHRRSGLCPAEPGRDGGFVYVAVGTIRAGECHVEQQSPVLEVGADLQGPHDHGGGHRPVDPSFGDHRAEHPQLSPRSGQAEKEAHTGFEKISTWIRGLANSRFPLGHSNCR